MREWIYQNVLYVSSGKYGTCFYLHFISWFFKTKKLRVSFGLLGRRWLSYDWEPKNPWVNRCRGNSDSTTST